MNATGCGHIGEHAVLEVYPLSNGEGWMATAPIGEDLVLEKGTLHTVKVKCLTCGCISLMPMTFPKEA